MKDFYWKFYNDVYAEAIKDSEEYSNRKAIREELEEELTVMLGGIGSAGDKKLNEYVTAYGDEMDIMMEGMYLLGAQDREKMLR